MKSTSSSVAGTAQDADRDDRKSNTDGQSEDQPGKSKQLVSTAVGSTSNITSRASWRVIQASVGDHPAIHSFLTSIFRGPSTTEFQAQLENPTYEPIDRLLIKDGDRIVAHLRMASREMRFGTLTLPVGLISDLATLPEYRGHGCASALLREAEKQLLRDGAVLGLLQTDQPRFYARYGWTVSGRHCYSTAGPREILSHLQMREAETALPSQPVLNKERTRQPYNIRLWRHVELAALVRLFSERSAGAYGPLERSDAYWRWLAGRGGHEQVYVAIDGPDKLELDESLARIVGYATTREGRIVETVTSPDHPEASIQLLARTCGDAIERDFHVVRVDAPPGDPIHELLIQAGGQHFHHEADQGMVFMANILKPRRFLKVLARNLSERAKQAGLPRPCQLGLLLNDDKYSLQVSRRGVTLEPGKLGRSYLKCTPYDLRQLLLGHVDVREAAQSGRLGASTRVPGRG